MVSELSRQVTAHDLLQISEVEQDMACQGQHAAMVEDVRRLLASPQTRPRDRARLVMLYGLRYAKHSSSKLREFMAALEGAVGCSRL